jgi:hypothetical protein
MHPTNDEDPQKVRVDCTQIHKNLSMDIEFWIRLTESREQLVIFS